ncbi:TonB-dependent receptor plug domain-containing protein [Geoalkalibacter halelectricus]|uniref:TonB-dependent receptor n=1 Tax=Geoalkalibacter halelectricus TaxID=2847045 RepID=A0ABY5ZR68_9BACT|nr:TonB-dependent receptor [Geoalkalibacter halelectricus]MDO3380086.1 TonB-dependent receptor [Geoalkalibacter halelectricus]UWZ80395.1 TonB-dependent receptor [Geoalkalibacter halelectricus]
MRHGLRGLSLALVLILFAPLGSRAIAEMDFSSPTVQEMRDFYGDEAFITIATGSRKPVYRAPAVATVITAAEIKAMGARSLDEVLETVAGLHVVPSALNRLDSIYSIRGIHTGFNPHVLLLMNGVPFTNNFNGGRPILFRLPVSNISRVEVIRGPGSAVYGADAFAGVINIITKDATDIDYTEVGGRAGSFGNQDLWLQHAIKSWPWHLNFALDLHRSDGDRHRKIDSDLQSALDQEFGTNASLAPGALKTDFDVLNLHLNLERGNWQIRNWYWQQDNAGQGAGGVQALDAKGGHSENLYLFDVEYKNADVADHWDLNARANYLYRKTNSRLYLFPPGARIPIAEDGNVSFDSPVGNVLFPDGVIGNPIAREDQIGFDIVSFYNGFSNHRLRFGTGIKYQSISTEEYKNFGPGVIDGSEDIVGGALVNVTGTPFIYLPDKSRTVFFLSVQDEWQISRNWEVTTGVRFDHYSDFGKTINPRIALVWATRHNLTTKLMYGRAFRAPSFSEQFAINNPVILGNPNLNPETIDTVELALVYRPIFDMQIGLNLFGYKANDLIEFIPDTGVDSSTAQNSRNQDGYGFELEGMWDFSETLRLRGNYAWQRSIDKDTRHRIPDAPGQQLYISADWQFLPQWLLHPQLNWVGSRKRAEGDLRENIKDYTLVGVTLRREEILKNLDFAVAARNIFDEDGREPSTGIIGNDYPVEGRHFWGELSYRF